MSTAGVLKKLGTCSYFSLTPDDQNIAKKLKEDRVISSFNAFVDPRVIDELNPELRQFFVFVDGHNASMYTKVRDFLKKSEVSKSVSSYNLVGDLDFLAMMFSDHEFYEGFLEKLESVFSEDSSLRFVKQVSAYEFSPGGLVVLGGSKIRAESPDIQNLEPAELELLQQDYLGAEVMSKLGNEENVKRKLADLERHGVISGYSITKTELLKFFNLIAGGNVDRMTQILYEKQLKGPVINLYPIVANPNYVVDPYYASCTYLIEAEFSDVHSFHSWREKLAEIEVYPYSFEVASVISSVPRSIGNYPQFNLLAEQYSFTNSAVFLGWPVYILGVDRSKIVRMDPDSLTEHGFIIGAPRSGKTTTGVRLMKKLFDLGKIIHIFDSTGGIQSKVEEIFVSDTGKIIRQTRSFLQSVRSDFLDALQSVEPGVNLYTEESNESLAKFCELAKSKSETPGRALRHVVLIEEAATVFEDKELSETVTRLVTYAGRKGIGILFSTHNLSLFPETGKNGSKLYEFLGNRIIQKQQGNDASLAAKLLSGPEKNLIYGKITDDIRNLPIGEAFVSLKSRSGEEFQSMPPIRVKFG